MYTPLCNTLRTVQCRMSHNMTRVSELCILFVYISRNYLQKKKDIIHVWFSLIQLYLKKFFFLNIHFFQIYKETSKVFVIFCYHYGILSLIFLILIYICFIYIFHIYMFHNLLKFLRIYIKTSCVSSDI